MKKKLNIFHEKDTVKIEYLDSDKRIIDNIVIVINNGMNINSIISIVKERSKGSLREPKFIRTTNQTWSIVALYSIKGRRIE